MSPFHDGKVFWVLYSQALELTPLATPVTRKPRFAVCWSTGIGVGLHHKVQHE